MNSSAPLVAIVVLNFNGKKCLLSCLRSLAALHYPHFFTVVVDNNSKDDSYSLAKEFFPQHIFIKNAENKGFSGGMNIGMKAAFEAGAQWVWLFNNDATTDPSTLDVLIVTATSHPQIGLLSPLIYGRAGGALWFGKGRINTLRMRAEHQLPSNEELEREYYASEFLTGCALLVSKPLFERIGGLDEDFFLYYEDVDYSVRAKSAGYEVVVVPGARVFHAEQSEEQSEKIYHLVLSGLIFFKKQALFYQKLYFLVYGTIRRLKNALDLLLRRPHAKRVYQAYHDFYHVC